MSIKPQTITNPLLAAILMLILLNPLTTVSARTSATPTVVVTPATLVTTQGSAAGVVTRLRVKDQSGTADTAANYVLFQTPGVAYKGYRTFTIPASVSPGMVTSMVIKVNYKGPAKATQTWSWYLFDWVNSIWVKVGDNTGTTLNVWKLLQYNATGDVTRFINNSTRQVRLQLTSNNAVSDAKLDYEAITLGYDSCADPLGCVLVQPTDTMHIAYLLNMPIFESKNGAMIAIDDAGGVILGHTIQFDGISRDQCDTVAASADAAKLLMDASILAILGTTCSGEARAILPAISTAGFSMVSPSNTAVDLADPGTPGYLRVVWNDKQQGEAAAEYADSLGLTKAATMWDSNDPYSVGNVQSFENTFTTAGGTITMQKTITSDQMDMRTELTALGDTLPEIVYFPVFSPAGGYIINQARVTSGLKFSDGVLLMGADGLYDKSVMLSTGNDLEGFLVTGIDWMQFAPYYTDAGGFVDDYLADFGVKPSDTGFGAYGYDAFNVVKAAIETSAVDLGNGNYMIGRQALRNALYATSGFAGLTGTLTCQPDGDCAETPALGVYQYTAGAENPDRIWPIVP